MRISATAAALLFVVLCPPAGEAQDKLTLNDKRLFFWFDRLEIVSKQELAEAKLIRVVSSETWVDSANRWEPSYDYALLINEVEHSYELLGFDLCRSAHDKTKDGKAASRQPLDIKTESRALLGRLAKPDFDAWPPDLMLGPNLRDRTRTFLLARVCAAQGHENLAHRLIAAAGQKEERSGEPLPRENLLAALSREIGHNQMWRAVVAFGNAETSRAELLKKFEAYCDKFPGGKHHARATETAVMLKQMVREDIDEAARRKKPGKVDRQEKIRRLIFDLRDQNGQQWSQPGSCDIFLDPRDGFRSLEESTSPASQLVKIGYDAIPQLIEALDDERFTRSVGYWRDFTFSHRVLRVGDCAERIISRIAGRNFANGRQIESDIRHKAVIEQWWRQAQAIGEYQMLADGVVRGDRDAPTQARELLRKYPKEAFDSIARGTRASRAHTREAFLRVVSEIEGGEADALLRDILHSTERPQTRALCARILASRGQLHESLSAILAVMKTEESKRDPPQSLLMFLAESGTKDGVDLVAKRFDSLSVDQRLAVVSTYIEGHTGISTIITSGGMGLAGLSSLDGPGDFKETAAAQHSIRQLLLKALADTEHRRGMSGAINGISFADPRVCDFAAYALASRWPEEFKFELTASTSQRERQRVLLLNSHRRANGLSDIPVPESHEVTPVAAASVDPLLQALIRTNGSDERKDLSSRIQALGPGAFAAVQRTMEEVEDGNTRADLRVLAGNLRNTVVAADLTDSPAKARADFQRRLDELKGKPLTSKSIVDLVCSVTRKLPPGAVGIVVTIEREESVPGILLRCSLPTKKVLQGGSQKGWDKSFTTIVNGELEGNASGFASLEYGRGKEAYSELGAQLQKALRQNHWFESSLSVILGR